MMEYNGDSGNEGVKGGDEEDKVKFDEDAERMEVERARREYGKAVASKRRAQLKWGRVVSSQREEMKRLKGERDRLREMVSMMQGARESRRDASTLHLLTGIMTEKEEAEKQRRQELKSVEALEEQILMWKQKYEKIGTMNMEQIQGDVKKRMEGREMSVGEYKQRVSEVVRENMEMRGKIDSLVSQHELGQDILEQTQAEVDEMRTQLADMVDLTTVVCNKRDEVVKMSTDMKHRQASHVRHHNRHMQDLLRQITDLEQGIGFTEAKGKLRARERHKGGGRRLRPSTADRIEGDQSETYAETLSKVCLYTKMDTLESVLQEYERREERNMALFRYVQGVVARCEGIEWEIEGLHDHMERWRRGEEEMKRWMEERRSKDEDRYKIARFTGDMLNKRHGESVRVIQGAYEAVCKLCKKFHCNMVTGEPVPNTPTMDTIMMMLRKVERNVAVLSQWIKWLMYKKHQVLEIEDVAAVMEDYQRPLMIDNGDDTVTKTEPQVVVIKPEPLPVLQNTIRESDFKVLLPQGDTRVATEEQLRAIVRMWHRHEGVFREQVLRRVGEVEAGRTHYSGEVLASYIRAERETLPLV